jgi:hypothetical protein
MLITTEQKSARICIPRHRILHLPLRNESTSGRAGREAKARDESSGVSPGERPGELVGRDERVAPAAPPTGGAALPSLEAEDEIRVQEAVEEPEAVVGRRGRCGGRVLHPARGLLLPHPAPPADTNSIAPVSLVTHRGRLIGAWNLLSSGEVWGGTYLKGTRQTAAEDDAAAARESRLEVDADTVAAAVAAVAMGPAAGERRRDGIWAACASELATGPVLAPRTARAACRFCFFVWPAADL